MKSKIDPLMRHTPVHKIINYRRQIEVKTMDLKNKVRHLYYRKNKSKAAIVKELSISKNTLNKLLTEERQNKRQYNRTVQPSPKLGAYHAWLDEMLTENEKLHRKQQLNGKQLYDALVKKNYTGSYKAVANYIAQFKAKRNKPSIKDAFIPQSFMPGEKFQFDWSEETVILAGESRKIKVAQIRLCYSRFSLVIAYPNEQLEMLLDAHDVAFRYFGGACQEGVYDNMKTVVDKIFKGKARKYNERFLALCGHYVFQPIACTPRSGWEKGQVERQVAIFRSKIFTPTLSFDDFAQLDQYLQARCIELAKEMQHPEQSQKSIWEVYQEEKSHLQLFPGVFNAFSLISTELSKTCLVNVDTNRYSGDCRYANKAVYVHRFAWTIKIYCDDTCIGEHRRRFTRKKVYYEPWHYVPLLERKPGALRNGAPFKDWKLPKPIETLRQLLATKDNREMDFIRLMLAVEEYGLEAITNACQYALDNHILRADIILSTLKTEQPEDRNTESCDAYDVLYQRFIKEV